MDENTLAAKIVQHTNSKERNDIEIEVLRKLISYDPDTGVLTWLPRTAAMFMAGAQSPTHNAAIWNGKHAGKEALTAVNSSGHRVGAILGQMYLAHRVAWVLLYGEWPVGRMTHKNGNRADNRASNLKGPVKRRVPVDITGDGVEEIRFFLSGDKWCAEAIIHGETKDLGEVESLEFSFCNK